MRAKEYLDTASVCSDLDARVGTVLCCARLDSGMSQGEIANKLQTSTSHIRDLERGRRRLRLSEAILYANCIQLPTAELYLEAKGAMEDDAPDGEYPQVAPLITGTSFMTSGRPKT